MLNTLNDELDEFNETFTVTLSVTPSPDPRVTLPADPAWEFSLLDNDPEPLVSVASVTAGEGAALEFPVSLSAPSGRDVAGFYETSDGTATAGEDYTAKQGSVTIPAGDTSAVVSVATLTDDADEDVQGETMTLTLTGFDYGQPGTMSSAVGTILDEVLPAVLVSPPMVSVTEEAAGTSADVSLATEPTASVTVALTPQSGVTVSTTSMTFTTSNWDTAQTVTVAGAADDDGEHLETTMSLAATSSDPDYAGKTASLAVTVLDNDTLGVDVTPTALDIDEGGSGGVYTVALLTQPTGTVTIGLEPYDSDLTVTPATLDFTTSNWAGTQSFTVTADDPDKLDDSYSITHTVMGGGYAGVPVPGVQVNVTDDRTAPGPPEGLVAITASGEVELRWQAPDDDGGHPITGYQAKRDSGSWTATGSALPGYTATGLTNDTEYQFRVRARNTLGAGAAAGPISATPAELAAPWNFRVVNGTLTNGVWYPDSNDVELDWDLPEDGVGNHLTHYWVRPGHTCPEGSDGGRNLPVIDGDCPLLTLYTQYGTRITRFTDTATVGLTYVYRIQAYKRDETPGTTGDRTFGSAAEIIVRPPDLPPFVPTHVTGLTTRSSTRGTLLVLKVDWDDTPNAPAYVIQIRQHDGDFANTPTGTLSSINRWSGPQLYGADGKYFHKPARSDHVLAVNPRNDNRLDYGTLYYVRVGTCLTVDCDLGDAAFAPERSIRTPADPN